MKRDPSRGCSARHSRPSKLERTGPRKYRSCCGGGAPSKRIRIAMLSSSASEARLPTCMVADSPLRPLIASPGIPHSGPKRGNSRNSTAITGAPNSASMLAVRATCSSGGLPTGMWALTSAVSRPSRASSIAAAVSSACEKKKLVSIVKKPRKKITNASRRARSSSVFSASRITIRVTPASRPSSVRWVNHVAPSARTSSTTSHHWLGRRRAVSASQPRHSSTPAASEVHHQGRWPTWGSTTQPITSSRNSVSRVSRGSALSVSPAPTNMSPVPPGSGACAPRRSRARSAVTANAGRSPAPACRPAAPRR